jgi:hypothetical protein
MNKIQSVLAIAENEDEEVNSQIKEFIRKSGEMTF